MTHYTNAFMALLVVSHLGAASTTATPEKLIASGAQMKKLSGGFTFTEGPAVDAEGNIYFSDIPNSRIHKWSLEDGLSTFREDTEQANGLFFRKRWNPARLPESRGAAPGPVWASRGRHADRGHLSGKAFQ